MDHIRRFYVYCYAEPGASHPFYIGKGQGERAFEHLTGYYLRGRTHFYAKLRKMLRNGIEPRIDFLYVALTEEEAFDLERSLIRKWGRLNLGTGCLCNLTDGGDGASGAIVSTETRARIGEKSRGRVLSTESIARGVAARLRNLTPEVRERLGRAHRGKTISPENRAKVSAAHRGKIIPAETRAKMSAAKKGKIRSPEHSANIAAAKRGKPLSAEHCAKLSAMRKGKPLSPERKENMSKAQRRLFGRSVQSIDPHTGDVKIYSVMADVELEGFTRVGVRDCCRGRTKNHRGLIWSYVDPDRRASTTRPDSEASSTAVVASHLRSMPAHDL
jgi:hypothetical protein